MSNAKRRHRRRYRRARALRLLFLRMKNAGAWRTLKFPPRARSLIIINTMAPE